MTPKIIIWICTLISLVAGAHAISYYCSDTVCDNYESYNETDPTSEYYCPVDCGIYVNESWCISEYTLFEMCPGCGRGGGSPDITEISDTTLQNWCATHQATVNSGSESTQTGTNNSSKDKYIYWIIFLLIGLIIGRLTKQKNKRRK